MRIFSLLTALIVAGFLYFFVVERDRLYAWIGVSGEDATADEAQTEDTAETTDPLPEGTVRVVARKSQARDVESAVIVRGETDAMRQVTVMAQTTGTVVSDPLRAGAEVTMGDVLCQIDPGTTAARMEVARAQAAEIEARRPETEARIAEAEAQVLGAKAALEEARINADNAQKLSERGFSSTTTVASTTAALSAAEAQVISAEASVKAANAGIDALDAQLESARSALAEAEREIERLTITAPFSGLLETDAAELGSLLQPGTACATVIQLDPMKIVGYVPEIDVARIANGAPAGARLIDGREVSGTVSFVGRSADEQTRTFRVELLVDNPDLALRDGQTAEIVISTDGRTAHLLPQSALTLDNDGTLGVRLVTAENTALFQPVSILRDTQDGVWLDGLPDQADVILLGQEYVTDGVPVLPSYEEITQ